jgi:hypothetical protein
MTTPNDAFTKAENDAFTKAENAAIDREVALAQQYEAGARSPNVPFEVAQVSVGLAQMHATLALVGSVRQNTRLTGKR